MIITALGNLIRGLLFLGLVCFVMPISAQTSAVKSEKELQQKRELQQKANALVEEIATGAHGLKLPENRSFVLTSAADLLWPYDEKRARALFWDALNSINLMIDPGGNSSKIKKNNEKHYFALFTLRQGLLRSVAKHDPQLALDMLRVTRQLPVEQVNANFRLPDDSDLEQQIAAEAAARNPERGLHLARESLAKGLTFQLLELLKRLNQRDREVATKFAGDIIDKLQTRNVAADIVASHTAIQLIRWSRTPTGPPPETDSTVNNPYQIKLEAEQRRRLVELIANAALSVSANSTLLNSVEEMLPEIREFVPERVALIERKVRAFEQTLNSKQRRWKTYDRLVRDSSPEDMIAGSVEVDDEHRQSLRELAIGIAVYRRRADALREFIKNEIDDDSLQRSLIDELDTEQISAATVRGDADELRKLLPGVRRKEERARAMAELAVVLEKKGDHDEAVKLLDEARTFIRVDFESETQSNALLALVAAYSVVEPAKAFAIVERTIDRANDQIAKALLLDKIVRSGVIKNGELLMQNSTTMSPEYILIMYGKSIVALANADFNRTRAAANRFERMELRIMMRLLLAQSLMEDGRRTK